MELGMIGLGRMGLGMAQRLHRGGHRVVGFARSADTRARAQEQGVEPAASIEALVGLLQRPRAVWMMVPAGDVVDETLAALSPLLAKGDTIIDGGNSNYKDTQRRAKSLSEKEIDYIDCGTSGGVWGLEQGYSLMIGGDERATERLRPIFVTLAPAPDKGWGRVGTSGAGHFTKMVHNGIEYGLMQAYGEGFALMQRKEEFALDLHQVAQIWRDGSVVRATTACTTPTHQASTSRSPLTAWMFEDNEKANSVREHPLKHGLSHGGSVILARAPFHVARVIDAAGALRNDVIGLEAGARSARRTIDRAGVQPLELRAHEARTIGGRC